MSAAALPHGLTAAPITGLRFSRVRFNWRGQLQGAGLTYSTWGTAELLAAGASATGTVDEVNTRSVSHDPADAPHSCTTTSASAGGCAVPCGSCPWRVGAHPDRIPGFDARRADTELRDSADDGSGDAFRSIMACHLSSEGDDRPCVGYVVSADGWANLAVRMAAITGAIDLAAMRDACDGLDLHDSFDVMLDELFAAGGITLGTAAADRD